MMSLFCDHVCNHSEQLTLAEAETLAVTTLKQVCHIFVPRYITVALLRPRAPAVVSQKYVRAPARASNHMIPGLSNTAGHGRESQQGQR